MCPLRDSGHPQLMLIDHIYIFSDTGGSEADQLAAAGLTESPGRVHPGQGTRNRKFLFDGFFLEVLWVHDAVEAMSPVTAPTGLLQRAQFAQTGQSRFGVCLHSTAATTQLLEPALPYQPSYLPAGSSIQMLTNAAQPELPMVFSLPTSMRNDSAASPAHSIAAQQLTKAVFTVNEAAIASRVGWQLQTLPGIKLVKGHRPTLLLEFDNRREGQTIEFPSLDLTISY